jgi:hypothetical protein
VLNVNALDYIHVKSEFYYVLGYWGGGMLHVNCIYENKRQGGIINVIVCFIILITTGRVDKSGYKSNLGNP